MSRRTLTAILTVVCLLTALNVGGPVLNLFFPARAAIAKMSYEDLVRDPDFARAVHSIVQKCKVNVELAKLEC